MLVLLTGWLPTAIKVGIIAAVFLAGYVQLGRELAWVRALVDLIASDLAMAPDGASVPAKRTAPTILDQHVRDEIDGVRKSADPVWAFKQVRGWQMRAQRLESALAFWVDLLRQLGLLGTVLGLAISLVVGTADARQLLAPLGLAVWATVAGLAFSLVLSAKYAMAIGMWADTCEKNVEAWDQRRRARLDRGTEATP